MPLFRCTTCGCIENTALSDYWIDRYNKRPVRCSECATGKWHGSFAKRSAAGMLIDDAGHLWSPEKAKNLPPGYKIVGEVPK